MAGHAESLGDCCRRPTRMLHTSAAMMTLCHVRQSLNGVCPNCGGELVRRPRRVQKPPKAVRRQRADPQRAADCRGANTVENDPIVIVGAARTPMAAFQGDFASLAASDLGAVAIKAAVERAGVAPADVDETIFGCVLPAGQGQAPARQASLKAGLPLRPAARPSTRCAARRWRRRSSRTTRSSPDRRHHRRRRHGEHEPRRRTCCRRRAAATGWVTSRWSTTCSSTASRTRTTGAADGDVRRGVRRPVRVHARSAGRVRAGVASHARSPPTTTARSRGKSRR